MRTRQTNRETISLPGRYFTGLGKPEDVTLSDLSVGGCRFALGQRKLLLGAPVQIYVGSSGPHRATVRWTKDGEAGVTFRVPLPKQMLASLQDGDIPDAPKTDAMDAFDDMTDAQPQRFC